VKGDWRIVCQIQWKPVTWVYVCTLFSVILVWVTWTKWHCAAENAMVTRDYTISYKVCIYSDALCTRYDSDVSLIEFPFVWTSVIIGFNFRLEKSSVLLHQESTTSSQSGRGILIYSRPSSGARRIFPTRTEDDGRRGMNEFDDELRWVCDNDGARCVGAARIARLPPARRLRRFNSSVNPARLGDEDVIWLLRQTAKSLPSSLSESATCRSAGRGTPFNGLLEG